MEWLSFFPFNTPYPFTISLLLTLLFAWGMRRHQQEQRAPYPGSPTVMLRLTIGLAALGVLTIVAMTYAGYADWIAKVNAESYARIAGGGAIVLALVTLRGYIAARRKPAP